MLEQLGIDAGKERAVHDVGPASNGFRRCVGCFFFVGGFTRSEAESGAASGDTRFSFGFTDDPDLLGSVVREPE